MQPGSIKKSYSSQCTAETWRILFVQELFHDYRNLRTTDKEWKEHSSMTHCSAHIHSYSSFVFSTLLRKFELYIWQRLSEHQFTKLDFPIHCLPDGNKSQRHSLSWIWFYIPASCFYRRVLKLWRSFDNFPTYQLPFMLWNSNLNNQKLCQLPLPRSRRLSRASV